jgi:hypothetical protein
VVVPVSSATVPTYLVPSHTTSITAVASARAPIFFDYSWFLGDPDLISSSAPDSSTASGTFASSSVAPGNWVITPFQQGPDGPHGVAPVTASTSLTATTDAFDPAVTSTTGDLWLASTNLSSPLNTVVVDPGQTATIPVTIRPSAAVGSVVAGTLYVDDLSSIDAALTDNPTPAVAPTGSDVSAISYEYTVGGKP